MIELPSKLGKPPLVEAILEVRFAAGKQSVSQLLPGMLYGQFSKKGFTRSSVSPLATLPREVRAENTDFTFMHLFKLESDAASILVGEQMVAISKTAPYGGWLAFREHCVEVLTFVKGSGLFGNAVRVSMKCVNLIEDERNPLDLLHGTFKLDAFAVAPTGLRLRLELDRKPVSSILELLSGITV